MHPLRYGDWCRWYFARWYFARWYFAFWSSKYTINCKINDRKKRKKIGELLQFIGHLEDLTARILTAKCDNRNRKQEIYVHIF
jgi:hypothetical protein